MARGIFSALGWWPPEQLPDVLARLTELARRITAGEPVDETPVIRAAIDEIERFAARIGRHPGLAAESVSTPRGPAIELGNLDHVAFGIEHEEAAQRVASCLRAVLDEMGAT